MITKNILTTADYHNRYLQNTYLYEGMAYLVFPTNSKGLWETDTEAVEMYPQMNLFKRITDTFKDLTLYENPKFIFDDEKNLEFFEDWSKENDLIIKLNNILTISSIAGDCVVILYQKEDESWGFKHIQNDIWEPEYDEYNLDEEAKINHLFYKYKVDKKDYTIKKTYQYYPEDNLTIISYTAVEGGRNIEIPEQIKQKLGITDETEQIIEGKLFFRLKNDDSLISYFGLPDYTENIKAIVRNINFALETLVYNMVKAGVPFLSMPQAMADSIKNEVNAGSTKDEDGKSFDNATNLRKPKFTPGERQAISKALKKLDFFAKPNSALNGDSDPKFIQASPTAEQIEIVVDRFIQICEQDSALPSVLLNQDFKTGQLTGVSLQRLIQPTLHKKHSKELRLTGFLQDLIWNLLFLNGMETEMPSIEYYDGIIDNPLEALQEIESLLANNLITQKEAVKRANKSDTAEAESIIQEIQAEKGEIPFGGTINLNTQDESGSRE